MTGGLGTTTGAKKFKDAEKLLVNKSESEYFKA
jgi:hypothetical protein